ILWFLSEACGRLPGMGTKYLYFYGHEPKQTGAVGRECLSRWFPSPSVVDGVRFATAEHYMMWGKARLFGDAAAAEKIVKAKHPRQAKALGRSAVRGFDEDMWVANRLDIVTAGNVEKFRQNPDLPAFLVAT